MPDVSNLIIKLNELEVDQDKPLSEQLMTKFAGNINGLIDRSFYWNTETFSSSGSWVCPDNVFFIEVFGVGGGGGGGNGSNGSTSGSSGSNGTSSTFNTALIAAGGGNGGGATVVGSVNFPGVGGEGGSNGSTGGRGPGNPGGAFYLDGTAYGKGGGAGAGSGTSGFGGGGGGAGYRGSRLFATVPGNSYAYVVGTGGAGSASGANGVIQIRYVLLVDV